MKRVYDGIVYDSTSAAILAAQSHNARGVGLCQNHEGKFFLLFLSSWPGEPESIHPISNDEVGEQITWFEREGVCFVSRESILASLPQA